MSNFSSIPNYPNCPTFISNSDTFAYAKGYPGKHQYGRFRASFVSTQTGAHKFFAICNERAQIHIELNPKGTQKIFDMATGTSQNWNER